MSYDAFTRYIARARASIFNGMEVRVCNKNKCIASETNPLKLTRFLATFSGLRVLLTSQEPRRGVALLFPFHR